MAGGAEHGTHTTSASISLAKANYLSITASKLAGKYVPKRRRNAIYMLDLYDLS